VVVAVVVVVVAVVAVEVAVEVAVGVAAVAVTGTEVVEVEKAVVAECNTHFSNEIFCFRT